MEIDGDLEMVSGYGSRRHACAQCDFRFQALGNHIGYATLEVGQSVGQSV